jgi:hypothetical protein
MPLSEDLAIVIAEMDGNISHMESVTAGLTHEQFNWQAAPGSWSIGECLSHLNIVNGGDLASIKSAIDHGRARHITGTGPFRYGFLAKKLIASQSLPIRKKFTAPARYVPPQHADLVFTVAEYRRVNAEIRKLSVSAEGLDLARVKIDIPPLPAWLRPFLKMELGARLALIATHDHRHLWQAEQVRLHKQFPL